MAIVCVSSKKKPPCFLAAGNAQKVPGVCCLCDGSCVELRSLLESHNEALNFSRQPDKQTSLVLKEEAVHARYWPKIAVGISPNKCVSHQHSAVLPKFAIA